MLELETKVFEEKLPELLKTDEGRFVLIKEEKIIGTYSTQREAVRADYQNFYGEAFFVRPVLARQMPVTIGGSALHFEFGDTITEASKPLFYTEETKQAFMVKEVWVFNGAKGSFPSGVFLKKSIAERWIEQHGLSGTLTCYPVDKGVYDWAIEKGHFSPKKDSGTSASFIQTFSSASQEHHHYADGFLE